MRKRTFVSIISLTFIVSAFASIPAASSFAADATASCKKSQKIASDANVLASSDATTAANKLREAIAYCPGSAALRYNLAVVLYSSGNTAEAEASLEEALKINPDYAKALNDLANIIARKPGGNRSRAEYLAQRAVNLDPPNADYQHTLASIVINVDKAPKTTQFRPDAVAVVIGNRNYGSRDIPDVKYAENDAKAVRKYLTDTFGVPEGNIIEAIDAPLGTMNSIFGTDREHRGLLYSKTRPNESDVFIYYTGHGAPDSVDKKAYLVPSDANPNMIRVTGYSLETLYANMEKLSSERSPRSITIVIDACFSGRSEGGMLIKDASPISLEAALPTARLKNAAIFASSNSDQISSWYHDKKHSLFTYFFLKAIKTSVESSKPVTATALRESLLAQDSVNDFAWRLHGREQQPQIMGDMSIVYVQ